MPVTILASPKHCNKIVYIHHGILGFKDGIKKGPDSRTVIVVLLHEILWKSVNLSVFAGKQRFTLAYRWFDFAKDSR